MGGVISSVSNTLGLGNVTDAVGLTNFSGDRALDAQTNAANAANATQQYMYDTTRADNEPWRQVGQRALTQLESGNVFGEGGFQADPGYQFRLSEGQRAIDAAASARGMRNSGAALKELARYGQDFASNEYNNAYNRQYNRISALAGIGQSANAQTQAAGSNYANNVSSNQIGLGNAQASNQTAAANRFGGLLGQGATAAAIYYSDERLKTDIKPIPKEDLDEMRSHLKAFYFKYKSDEYGVGQWGGVMAQDLEKSKLGKTLVVHDEAGNKMIDMKKVLSMFLATMAEA